MDKKVFYLAAGVLAVLLVILVVTVSMLGAKNQQSVPIDTSVQSTTQDVSENEFLNPADTASQVEPTPNEDTPEQAAKEFYEWYTTTQNPLGSGAYKNSPLISDYFQETLDGFVATNDHLTGDSVLACVDTRLIKSLVVQPAVYDQSNLKASVVLDDMIAGGASYKVLLSNINSQWMIDDVRCNL